MAEGETAGAAKGALKGGLAAAGVVFVAVLYWAWGQKAPEAPAPAAALVGQGATGAAQPEVAKDAPAPEAKAKAEAAAEPSTTEAASEPAAAEPAAAPAPVAAFDALRVSPEGAITLAGRAAPGAKVEVLLDGAVIDTVMADAQGAFASVVLGAPSAAARALTVRVTGADGVAQMAKEALTVAPSALALAQAATEAGVAPEAVAEQVDAAQTLAEKPLVTDATGAARVLAGAADALVIDTLAFAPDGAMALSGRGAPAGAVLRAYVDNVEAGLVQGGADGAWSMQLPAAAVGGHDLRLDALDAEGKVLARAETRFEGVAPADFVPDAALTQVQGAGSAAPEAQAENAPAPEVAAGSAAPAGAARVQIITVSQGNTLWAIARETYGDPYLYVRIFEANREQIRNPDLIYPGQVFTLPE